MNLYNGECLEIMGRLPDGCIDMVMCDLPYGTTQNKWDSVIPLDPLWRQYKRLCGGAIVLTAAQPFTSALVMSNLDGFKYQWYWRKDSGSGFLNAKKQPLRDVEDVTVFWSGSQTIYNPQMRTGFKPYKTKKGGETDNYRDSGSVVSESNGERYPLTCIEFNRDSSKTHPTQKPVALIEYLIKTYTNEGMTVLDNTMGSGTTGVACVNTNRKFIGIERDATYFNIAQGRIADAMLAKLSL